MVASAPTQCDDAQPTLSFPGEPWRGSAVCTTASDCYHDMDILGIDPAAVAPCRSLASDNTTQADSCWLFTQLALVVITEPTRLESQCRIMQHRDALHRHVPVLKTEASSSFYSPVIPEQKSDNGARPSAETPPNAVTKWLDRCELPTSGILARWDFGTDVLHVGLVYKRGTKKKEEFATLAAHIGSYDGTSSVFCNLYTTPLAAAIATVDLLVSSPTGRASEAQCIKSIPVQYSSSALGCISAKQRPENPSSTHCRDGGVTPTNVESRADIDWCDEMDKVPPHPPAGYDWNGQPQHLKFPND
ncbi:hypothetical protein MKX08_006374 [Trichoderma sp. CBMAI-0020]|nr:hypothetical protein MKX08_006374 [Trichoderma sp. CBMAI-0020]